MRYMTHAAPGAPLSTVLCSTNFGTAAYAAEEKPWWHLGMGKDATTEPSPSVTPAPTMTPAMPDITPVEEESWLKWPSMPKFGDRETTVVEQQPPATTAAVPERRPAEPVWQAALHGAPEEHVGPTASEHHIDRHHQITLEVDERRHEERLAQDRRLGHTGRRFRCRRR